MGAWRADTAVRPSIACFFHSPTIVWWMPCLVASCAVVNSPRSASRATFALNSAKYRFRLPVTQVRPSQQRAELNPLSEFRGPPQLSQPTIRPCEAEIEDAASIGSIRNRNHPIRQQATTNEVTLAE